MDSQWKELVQVLAGIQDSDLLDRFLKEILTPSEQEAILLRWKLVNALHEGKTQREIASELKISLCKITRGAKILKAPASAFAEILSSPQKHPSENPSL